MIDKILERKRQIEKDEGRILQIDSIMTFDNGKEESKFFKADGLHELRSVSKIFIALAYGIAIDRKMKFMRGGI